VQKVEAELRFIEPMECLQVDAVPEGGEWFYEIKHDGYRAIVIKQHNEVRVYSRNGKILTQFRTLYEDLPKLRGKSFILDGEIVAFDDEGKQSFALLQNVGTNQRPVSLFLFDVLYFEGHDWQKRPFHERRDFLETTFTKLPERVRISPELKGEASVIQEKLRELEFEGIIAKRRESIYEAGKRSGAWQKHKTQRSDEFTIGGYIGASVVDELVVGEKRDGAWHFVESIKNGFVPATRRQVYEAIKRLKTGVMPYVNLPEEKGGHRMDRDKMRQVHWLKPKRIAEIAFNERTVHGHLRHPRFLRLRPDKE
jgi:bifunctional non-homologous end joining protein LigD